MARLQNIGDSEDWFIGEDKTLAYEIYDSTEALIQDVSGWALRWTLREQKDSDSIKLNLTTTGSTVTITGSYNSDPTVNTQRVNAIIADTDTDNFHPGKYWYSLWRTDAGNETVLAYGDVHLKAAP